MLIKVTHVPTDDVRARNRISFDGSFGRIYSYWLERPWLARAVGIAMWGGDPQPFYERMRALPREREGSLVVDAPCGSGVAFAQLSPGKEVRYAALDLSPLMLERARLRARELKLDQIIFVQGDAEQMPFGNGSAGLLLSFMGLHCMPNPEAAVREIARCLRPGGRLVGAMICRGPSLRQRMFLRPGRGAFGPGGTVDDLQRWIASAGLTLTCLETAGAFAYFEATV
jgi:SAM-dependent methyltransferase